MIALGPRVGHVELRVVGGMSEDGKKKGRSPSYPAIDLEQALARAKALLEKESRHLVPVDTALEAWGYSPGSGAGLVVVAALKKFGLLEDQGSGADRRVRLTDEAYQVLIDEREQSPERCEILRQAALRPRIHAELWNRYGAELPSDSTLRYELRKMNYSDDASQKLTAEWKRTFDYAGLGDSVGLDESAPASNEEASAPATASGVPASASVSMQQAVRLPQAAGQSIQLPLSNGRWATLVAPFPISEPEWQQMMGVLQAMKPALAAVDAPSVPGEE